MYLLSNQFPINFAANSVKFLALQFIFLSSENFCKKKRGGEMGGMVELVEKPNQSEGNFYAAQVARQSEWRKDGKNESEKQTELNSS